MGLQLLLALIGLATAIFAWWVKNDADKKKRIADEDKLIETVTDADSTLIELDRLRNQPPSNRA